MKCIKCGNKKLEKKQERASLEIKGEKVDYIAEVDVCTKCGMQSASDEQMQLSFINASDAYRKKYHLLTSNEIVNFRKKMNMTQDQFANYLGVGVASLKRWENGAIQEKANDELIRLKCSKEKLTEQLYDLESLSINDIYRGNKQFDFNIFANVVVFLLGTAPSPLFYFKVLFYVDFLSFKRNGIGITGLTYSALPYGPCPSYYNKLNSDLINQKWVEEKGKHNLVAKKKFDSSLFTKTELLVLKEIKKLLDTKGSRYFYDGSHEESAWKNTYGNELISYELAKGLKLVR